ncbi:MAG: hypothetical protein K8I00_03330, partial [Candidatus Omnitrophica bacterium]|nr:hypothetical protein [Candidatus Omnitrophota bacterium]
MKKNILVLISSIILTTTAAQAELTFEHDTVVVTADRHERDAARKGSNVSVMTRQQIEASTARTVPELLQQVEGVFVSDNSTARTSTVD